MLKVEHEEQINLEPKTDFELEIYNIFRKRNSVVFAITGRRETGKTDLGLTIGDIVYTYNLIPNIATNIRFTDSPIPITYIGFLDDLESWAKQTRGKNLFILDEAGKAFKKRRPMSEINLNIIDKLQTLRKYGPLSLILCFPANNYIDNTALGSDVLDVMIDKPVFNNPKLANWYDVMEQKLITFIDLKRTRIKFDTYDSADFGLASPKKVPLFKDDDKQFLYEVHKKIKTNLTGQERQRKLRLTTKFVLEVLERERHT